MGENVRIVITAINPVKDGPPVTLSDVTITREHWRTVSLPALRKQFRFTIHAGGFAEDL